MIDLDNTLADRQAAFDHWVDLLAASCAGIAADREWIRVHDADGYRSREVFLDGLRQRHRLNRSLDDLLAEYRRG